MALRGTQQYIAREANNTASRAIYNHHALLILLLPPSDTFQEDVLQQNLKIIIYSWKIPEKRHQCHCMPTKYSCDYI